MIDGPLVIPQDFYDWGSKQGLSIETILSQCLNGKGQYYMEFSADKSRRKVLAKVIPGRLWSKTTSKIAQGPHRADVMVIGKAVSTNDVSKGCAFTGDASDIFFDAMKLAGWTASECSSMYLTNVLKTAYLDPSKSSIPKDWYNTQLILLRKELEIVRPKWLLLQGAEVVKLLLGNRVSMASVEDKCVPLLLDLREREEDPPQHQEFNVCVAVSPNAVLHDRNRPGARSKYKTQVEQRQINQLKNFWRQYHAQADTVVKAEDKFSYEIIRDTETLKIALERMREETEDGLIAWDAEWQGAHPQNSDHYLRCLQFAYKPGHAVVISLCDPGGRPSMYTPDPSHPGQWTTEGAHAEVARLCKEAMQGLRVTGHFFNADLEMLVPFGLDLRPEYSPPDTWQDVPNKGGFAIELAAHAWDETALFSLDDQIATHLDLPRYSQPLEKYKKAAAEYWQHWASDISRAYASRLSVYRDKSLALAKMGNSSRRYTEAGTRRYLELRKEHATAAEELAVTEKIKAESVSYASEKQAELTAGYGWMRDDVLYKYGAWDAVAEYELARKYQKLIFVDRFGNDCRRAYLISHRAASAVLEMSTVGLPVDREYLDKLTLQFKSRRDELLQEIRDELNWPGFNLRSVFEFAEALFGEEHNGYFQRYGKQRRCRPRGAKTLRIEPLRATGDVPRQWVEVRHTKQQKNYCAETTKQTLGELFFSKEKTVVRERTGGVSRRAYLRQRIGGRRGLSPISPVKWRFNHKDHSEIIGKMLDCRYLDHALKSLLYEPLQDSRGNLVRDEHDNLHYDKGIAACICDDGKVRMRIRQTVETGRWAGRDPNLMAVPKTREKDFKRLLKSDDVSLRAVIRPLDASDPGSGGEDWFFLETDYTGAELLVAAVMSQDMTMIDHCLRNQLPETDSNFYDIHSALTVNAFKLDCEPTKAGLKTVGKTHLRNVAKSIIFGVMYGRGANAITVALRQSGTYVEVHEVQQMITALFELYPDLKKFLDEAKRRVDIGWLCNSFGRYRRFPYTADEGKRASYAREAMNSPIQGCVADAVSTACSNFERYRKERGMKFKFGLTIHDAIIFMVPASELHHFLASDGIIRECMVNRVPLTPTDLNGDPLPEAKTYRFGCSLDVYGKWGEPPAVERLARNGLPLELAEAAVD